MQETRVSIQNLKVQVGQLSKRILERPPNTLSGDTEINPREECKALIMANDPMMKKETPIVKESEEKEALEKAEATVLHAPPRVPIQKPETPQLQKSQKETKDKQYYQFLEVFKKLHINISFVETLKKMSPYIAFMKGLLSEKKVLKEDETVVLTKECSTLIQSKLPKKMPNPRSFQIPCTIGNVTFDKALCDLGSSINLMQLSMMRKLKIQEVQPTKIALQMANKSLRQAHVLVENVLVKVGELFLLADFVILDMGEDANNSIILGKPFLATGRALIDVERVFLDIKSKFGVVHSPPTKEGVGPKKKVLKGWRNKKISTEDFSSGMKVIFTRSPVIPHTVNQILSLEHVELICESTGKKFTVRVKT
ncbi:uncharacterized protein LOC130940096 [Arachis stenosperma]|uniref:uncharacterized protein LOC130940096 n=1 Tax=Arachis stenosperma TaxID=217475 RepID=UPI0025AD030E|nr:uncharacterized protein LOC130940096 [Arachis stenosperma]